VECASADPREVTTAALDVLRGATDLPTLALRFLARSAGVDAGGLRREFQTPDSGRTAHDFQVLARAAIDAGAPDGPTRVALELCRLISDNCSSIELVRQIESAQNPSGEIARWQTLTALHPLLPPTLQPAILLIPPVAAEASLWLGHAAASIAELAQSVPQWMLGVAISKEAFGRYAREAPPSRARSLLLSGAIPIEADRSSLGNSSVGATGGGAARLPSNDEIVSNSGLIEAKETTTEKVARASSHHAIVASARLAESLENARQLQPRQDELARSAAERFLFELLESHPSSSGHFALNANPGFDFGPRAAEVDLLAMGLRLAIEVDGFFHFTDPESYRRDRRKDWELQRRGFVVVRVLADDVVMRMDEVLDFILTAIEHCRRERSD
jgi:hypothetical protein